MDTGICLGFPNPALQPQCLTRSKGTSPFRLLTEARVGFSLIIPVNPTICPSLGVLRYKEPRDNQYLKKLR